MNPTIAALCLMFLLLAERPAMAQEPSVAVADVETGLVLSANDIDVKRPPELSGVIALTFLVINDMLTGLLDPDEILRGDPIDGTRAYADLAAMATRSDTAEVSARASLAHRIARNPRLLDERISGLMRRIGMRATVMNSLHDTQGAPAWEGHTTARDVLRMTSALVKTHPDITRSLFQRSGFRSRLREDLWLPRKDGCVLVAMTPRSRRNLAAVIYGAATQGDCLAAAEAAIVLNDQRIENARSPDPQE